MDLLAADAIEDLNFQIEELDKELNEEELAHYVLINLGRLGADLTKFIKRLENLSKLRAYRDFFNKEN